MTFRPSATPLCPTGEVMYTPLSVGRPVRRPFAVFLPTSNKQQIEGA